MFVNRFEVAVVAAMLPRYSWPRMNAGPIARGGCSLRHHRCPGGRRRRDVIGLACIECRDRVRWPTVRRDGAPAALADRQDQASRTEVADGIDKDCHGRGEEPDDPTAERLAKDLGRRLADLQLGIALDELVALQDRRQVGLIGDVEEDRHQPVHEPDDVQLPDRQAAQRIGDRDRHEHRGTTEVADDKDPPFREAIDPHARRQREQEEGQELDRRQQADFAGRRVQQHGRDERDRDLADLGTEQRDGRGRPEASEVLVSEQAPARDGRRGHWAPRAAWVGGCGRGR